MVAFDGYTLTGEHNYGLYWTVCAFDHGHRRQDDEGGQNLVLTAGARTIEAQLTERDHLRENIAFCCC